MVEHKIASHSVRIWSSRSIEQASIGVAMEAVYVFDGTGKHRGTISFFPAVLEQLLDPTLAQSSPAVVSNDRIELRFEETQFMTVLAALNSGEEMCIYYAGPADAGLRVCQ